MTFKKKFCLLVAMIMAVSLLTACAPQQGSDEEEYPMDKIVPISIEDTGNAEKVIRTENFKIADNLKESLSAIELSPIFSNAMILQANVVTRIWGKSEHNGGLAVRLTDESGAQEIFYGQIADGQFEIYLGAQDYKKNCTLELITEDGMKRTLANVAFGEIFIGGGQSNMGWKVGQCYEGNTSQLLYSREIEESYNENIRLFGVLPRTSQEPTDDMQSSTGGWQIAQPGIVSNFSACGYFFAKEIEEKYDIPVGIVSSCMGGTNIFTWMPEEEVQQAQGSENMDLSSYYNAMIYPIRHFVVRGVLWYQGEGDNGQYYAQNLSLLIQGWRRAFARENLFFAIVQLPRYAADDFGYFYRREAQKNAALQTENCTYSVNIDLGLMAKDVAEGDTSNPEGIHPYDKKPLGERLAHSVMEKLYKAEGIWRSAVMDSVEVSKNTAQIRYTNVGAGLVLKGEAGFEAAGADGKFYPCRPELSSADTVKLVCDEVKEIKQIRYGYTSKNPFMDAMDSYADSVCLYNSKGDNKQAAYPAEQFLWQDKD